MKILLLYAYFRPEQISSSHLDHDFIEGLLAAGHTVEVVCPTPTRNVDPAVTWSLHETLEDGRLSITRFRAPKERRNPIFRAIRYFFCNLRTFAVAKKIPDLDAIYCSTTPPILGLVAAKLKKKRKIPFVYCVQDIFPDSLDSTGLSKKGSFLYRSGLKTANKIYSAADKIIVISEGFKKNLLAKGVEEKKLVVVPNWVNTDEVRKIDRADNILFDKYNLNRLLYYISYSGNLGHTQNLDMLLSIAKRMRSEMPDLRFVLLGDGAERERIAERVKNEAIENVILLPFQDYKDISHVFSLGDAGLIISKKGVSENSIPSKTFGYMAAERPILASFDLESPLSHLLSDVGCGVVADGDDEEGLVRAIYEIRKKPEIGACGREYLENNLRKEVCVGKYLDTLTDACNAEKE
ncbi:MAG: glycosyltransferase family 4 protein [Clostridia bacterium]|nr:glycosyltransferase family 4 protein [Clostridia bacterium]